MLQLTRVVGSLVSYWAVQMWVVGASYTAVLWPQL